MVSVVGAAQVIIIRHRPRSPTKIAGVKIVGWRSTIVSSSKSIGGFWGEKKMSNI